MKIGNLDNPITCPSCGYQAQVYQNLLDDRGPEDKCYFVCLKCAAVLQYRRDKPVVIVTGRVKEQVLSTAMYGYIKHTHQSKMN